MICALAGVDFGCVLGCYCYYTLVGAVLSVLIIVIISKTNDGFEINEAFADLSSAPPANEYDVQK